MMDEAFMKIWGLRHYKMAQMWNFLYLAYISKFPIFFDVLFAFLLRLNKDSQERISFYVGSYSKPTQNRQKKFNTYSIPLIRSYSVSKNLLTQTRHIPLQINVFSFCSNGNVCVNSGLLESLQQSKNFYFTVVYPTDGFPFGPLTSGNVGFQKDDTHEYSNLYCHQGVLFSLSLLHNHICCAGLKFQQYIICHLILPQ